MAQILIATLGSHGDIHPFIGIAQELRRRGHSVKLLAPAIYESLARQVNLPLVQIGTVEQFESFASNPDIWHRRKGFEVLAAGTAAMTRDYYHAIESNHIAGQTILVMSSLVLGGRLAQEKLGIPAVSVHLSPSLFRSTYAPPKLPPVPIAAWQPAWLQKLIFRGIDRWIIDRAMGPSLNAFRAELGLAPVRSIFGTWVHSPQRVIGLFPDWFAPPQPDWPANTFLTGFPLYDEADVTPMSDPLLKFLNAGSPPIAFTPGSGMRHGQTFFAAAALACRRLGRRGLLLTRHRDHVPIDLSPDVLHVEFAPFSQLLPRCAALVHHCGIGTLSQALAAGVPQVAMPMAHDQPDNADRIRRLGVAAVVPALRFNASTLTAALKRVIESPQISSACKIIAKKFIGTRPLRQTADLIEQMPNALWPTKSQ